MYNFSEGREKVIDAFESKIFSIKSKGVGILNLNHSKLNTKANASKITNSTCTSNIC